MTKIYVLIFCMITAFPAYAQFAAGYAPRYEEDEAQSEDDSSAFRTPSSVVEAPVYQPENVKKPTPYSGSLRILATVNGEIITTEDINNRVRAFCMTTGIPYNNQTKLLIINKVMQNTIDEKLKLQAAVNNKITISERDIDDTVKNYARSGNVTPEQFKQMLKENGVNEDIFREQMKSDIGWVRLVRSKVAGTPVTSIEIEDAIKATQKDMNQTKYMVLEIVISRKDGKDIQNLAQTLRQDPRFEMYAAQFSQSPSASSGGRLGWVNAGQLPEPLDKALQKMDSGSVSNPIMYNDSYYILKVEKKFDPARDKMPEPNAREISEMLQGQKTERYASRYLQNLRQQASIELKE